MSKAQTLTQLYEKFKSDTPEPRIVQVRNHLMLNQWLALRIRSAREHNESFFCTEIKEEGLMAICWVRKNSSFGIVYEICEERSLTVQQTFDFGESNLFYLGTKKEKKRMKLVSEFVHQLLGSEQMTSGKFNFAFLLFQHFMEGYLIHQNDYDELLFWCRKLLQRTNKAEQITKKRIQMREGEILEALGQYDEAIASYQKCISICETPDEFAHVYNCIGVVLRLTGKVDDSIEWYKKSLQAQQTLAAHSNLITAIQMKHGILRPARIDGYDHKGQTDSDYICQNCHKSGAVKICSRCRQVRYCNKKCQKQHWKRHKRICSSLRDGNQIPRW